MKQSSPPGILVKSPHPAPLKKSVKFAIARKTILSGREMRLQRLLPLPEYKPQCFSRYPQTLTRTQDHMTAYHRILWGVCWPADCYAPEVQCDVPVCKYLCFPWHDELLPLYLLLLYCSTLCDPTMWKLLSTAFVYGMEQFMSTSYARYCLPLDLAILFAGIRPRVRLHSYFVPPRRPKKFEFRNRSPVPPSSTDIPSEVPNIIPFDAQSAFHQTISSHPAICSLHPSDGLTQSTTCALTGELGPALPLCTDCTTISQPCSSIINASSPVIDNPNLPLTSPPIVFRSVRSIKSPIVLALGLQVFSLSALFDSGADYNCISSSVYNMIKSQLPSSHLNQDNMRVTAGNGQQLSMLGFVTSPIDILIRDSMGIPRSLSLHGVLVVDQLPHDIILGNPFLVANDVQITLKSRTITFYSSEPARCFQFCDSLIQPSIISTLLVPIRCVSHCVMSLSPHLSFSPPSSSDLLDKIRFPVYSPRPLILPMGDRALIPVSCIRPELFDAYCQSATDSMAWIFVPDESFEQLSGLIFTPGRVSCSNSMIGVVNISTSPIHLKAGQEIGHYLLHRQPELVFETDSWAVLATQAVESEAPLDSPVPAPSVLSEPLAPTPDISERSRLQGTFMKTTLPTLDAAIPPEWIPKFQQLLERY